MLIINIDLFRHKKTFFIWFRILMLKSILKKSIILLVIILKGLNDFF